MKKQCKFQKREQNKRKKNKKETNTITVESNIIIICDDGYVSLAAQNNNQVIDSSTSFHIASYDDFFISYTIGDFDNVKIGNSSISKIVDIEDIYMETSTRSKLILKHVRHVLDIRFNLIYIDRLDDERFIYYFGESKWKLTKGSLVMTRKEAKLFLCNGN